MSDFDQALAAATTETEIFDALYALTQTVTKAHLFTVMTVDMEAGLARRAYTNMPEAYPTSGTKPITRDAWFAQVHDRHETFVANTISDIAAVFPDYELINSLGCQSVLNLPVVLDGNLAATVNILNGESFFTPARVQEIKMQLTGPSEAAFYRLRDLKA